MDSGGFYVANTDNRYVQEASQVKDGGVRRDCDEDKTKNGEKSDG